MTTSTSTKPTTSTTTTTTTTVLVAVATVTVVGVGLSLKTYVDRFSQAKTEGDAVPGFPSPPNAHWLFGHLILLQGGGGKEKEDQNDDGDDDPSKPISNRKKTFIDGYKTVYVDYSDPETGRGSFWYLYSSAVSVLRGKDAKVILNASSYRKPTSLIDVHTKRFLGDKALVALMGKEWRLYRSAVHKSFTPAAIQQSQHIIQQVGDLLGDSLLAAPFTLAKEPHPILPLMKMATIDVFGRAALNVDLECCASLEMSPIAAAFEFLGSEYTRRIKRPWDPFSFNYDLPTPANRKHKQQQTLIRTFIAKQIAEVRKDLSSSATGDGESATQRPAQRTSSATATSDVLSNLVKAADAEATANRGDVKASDQALGDIMMTLIFGGYDTTSITLSYALYLLAKHPEYEQKCLEEIEAVLSDGSGSGTRVSSTVDVTLGLDQLPYTRAIVMETLRLYPPAPVTARNMEKELALPPTEKGIKQTLSKGQRVFLPIWSIQRDERNYPRPDEMIPERWVRLRTLKGVKDGRNGGSTWEERPFEDVRSNSSIIPPGNRDAFCVFATGARNCVGRVLAMQEAVTLLALLIRKCKFELVDSAYEVSPTSVAVIQQPDDDLPMIISPRR